MLSLEKGLKSVFNTTLLGAYKNYNERKSEKAAREANALAMYSWDLANSYNSPKAQMARLKAAGLNPNLVYGSGNVTGNTTSAPNLSAVSNYNGVNDIVDKGISMAQSYATLKNTNNQSELLKYQMGQTEAQTAYTQARTRDLNNFLNGNGPTTYKSGAGSVQTPSTLEDSSNNKDSYEDDVVELAPKAARPMTRRSIRAAKWVGKEYGDEVGNAIGWFQGERNPRKLLNSKKWEYRQKVLDNAYRNGRISYRQYLDEIYF